MAKSKKHKRKAKRQPAFYEAVPMFIVPAAPMTDIQDWRPSPTPWQFDELEQAKLIAQTTAIAGTILHKLRQLSTIIMAVGLATTNRLIQAANMAAYATHITTEATVTYGPSIAADLGRTATQTVKIATSRTARLLYLAIIFLGASGAVGVGAKMSIATLNSYASDISSPAALLARKKTGTTILDRNGQVLFEGYGAQVTKTVTLTEVPQTLKDATLAAEDPDFYTHPGVSWRATARAAWVDITHRGRVEGGSTLTQQLIKNTLLTSDKKFERKFQEILLAVQLEQRYSKDQILEMYLNEIYYGQGASGVEAASQTYFHKSAHDLTLAESALVAGLPLGPNRFDPNADRKAATGRRNYVLNRMLESGKITKAQADAAKTEPVVANARTIHLQAPHFVFYVLDQLRGLYGNDIVEQGGITVQTTLDLTKQHLGEQSVTRQVSNLASHHVTNGSLISLEPATGDILAMVGSVNYNTPGFGNVNVTLSQRQPGSSFKPIAYATAFKKGYTGATHVDDTPLDLPNGDGSRYRPQNYDGKFRGSVSLRRALANSLNIPAIKVLQHAGIHDTIQTAHDLGVTSLQDENRFGLALVLGGGEVSPLDMATVYATLANGGTRIDPRAILSVTDRHGKNITKPLVRNPEHVLDSRIAYMLTNILSDNPARSEEFGPNSPLKLSRPAAAKTGTTNDFRDNWTVGYTPQLATAVWVGNNDNSPMANVDGITGAAPIWHEYMEHALAGTTVAGFNPPAGITMMNICAGDGGLANPWDSSYSEAFMSDNLPTKPCNSQPTVKINPSDTSIISFVKPSHWPETPQPQPSAPPLPPKPERPWFPF